MGEEKKEKKRKHHHQSKDKEKKRSKSQHTLDSVQVKVESSVTPVLATFPGVSVPEDTKFQAYSGPKGHYVIHGETERMEYDGQNDPDEDLYYVGVYDPATRTVELMHTPVMTTTRTIKAYKKKAIAAVKQANVQNRVQRNALGEAFGTKKAKRVISDLERNKIEAEKLETYADSIVDNIKTATENLPSADALREQQSEERPIPPCDEGADDLNNIYPLYGLVSKEEFVAIRVGAIFREKDEKKRAALLPFKNSEYINSRVARINNENEMQRLKLLYYASLLMGLYNNRRMSNKRALLQKLNHPAEILVTGLIQKFTDSKVGKVGREKDASFTITPKMEDKLLCYLFVTCLRIDEYSVETPLLAAELSLRPTRVQDLFKALGCKIRPCTSAQKEALGLTNAEAANYKLATLSLPFKLPDLVRRRRTAQSRR
ncbi:RNA polymerase I associated factor, A49-like protein [Lipomyces tetrasporus]|uniref:RNA polymerase I associated factor, A49-like protein n=1 Tax=Lipomyces tetrasporus TaxID=54092 RepID=A0AAD7QVU9_9ASCO|nr:RNA polymerase I associated factor, A49-like protein [Lipomyces tetrasporus]KAJ8102136.1 RNA polymerase I associated factor, A49-like protein [Lipomyces tetrasporus]